MRDFDLIIFGASGFTGQFVVEELARTVQKDSIKWAISGRSRSKLIEVLAIVSEETGIDVKGITIVEADIKNKQSLRDMTAKSKIVLNCVGPYLIFGEPVVSACIETGTHLLDLSGEPQYMEGIQLKYNKLAQEKGIFIVSGCGWDTTVTETGIAFLKQQFNGELNSVEVYFDIKMGPQGFCTSYGTWLSAIQSFARANEIPAIRQRLKTEVYTKIAPKSKYKLKRRIAPFYSEHTNNLCMAFPVSQRSVVERSAQYRYEKLNERPIQIEIYLVLANIWSLINTILMGSIFSVLVNFEWGRYLLMSYPELLSLGKFSKCGPTRQQIRGSSFITTIVGKGWAQSLLEPSDEPNYPPDKTVAVQIIGKDPAYLSTSICLVQCGLTILKEQDKMPKMGGVLTNGCAYAQTQLLSRLQENNIHFELMKI